ncbi:MULTISPECIES: sensor histidine kinase [Clostridium]|uniref:sensor histidine kinase n=1 Tax=Clostridium TaxID=1485 RepID=UPI0008251FD7|nr:MULTISPECIES: sensor histidine kinase [Clostridium]PJI08480.1 sensor histidine kinase [Clostridium sp. CT7]
MSFNKTLINTFKKEKSAIFLYIISILSIILYYFFLYGKHSMSYPIILASTFLICYLIYKFFVYKNLYTYLDEGKVSPKYKMKNGYVFEDILNVMRELHGNYISKIDLLEERHEEKEKFLSEWIHNMKTSVAIIELASEKGKKLYGNEDVIKDIYEENVKLQENLESALNIFRLEEFAKDYIPEKINLKRLITDIVNTKKRNFIYGRVFPKIEIEDEYYIYTDKKWAGYVISQVINNAIKYAENTKYITFYCERKEEVITLHIKDTGIGIKKEELSRVFEPFFTGSNGRRKEKSTGIGLYMCKTICKMLNSNISIESEEGKGTIVSITFHACKVV